MDDEEFFDRLYQLWSKTTQAEHRFWEYRPRIDSDGFNVNAVGPDGESTWVATVASEADANWLTALHGCFGDLVRRLHEALDEAERRDLAADDAINRLAAAELRIMELTKND